MIAALEQKHWQRLQRLIGTILLLFSTMIGDDIIGPARPIPAKKMPLKNLKAPRIKQHPLPTAKAATINHDAFLASFKRQSHGQLNTCLRAWQGSPFEIALSADIRKSGRLLNIRPLEYQLPQCAHSHMATMDFSHITRSLGKETLTVQWRVSW